MGPRAYRWNRNLRLTELAPVSKEHAWSVVTASGLALRRRRISFGMSRFRASGQNAEYGRVLAEVNLERAASAARVHLGRSQEKTMPLSRSHNAVPSQALRHPSFRNARPLLASAQTRASPIVVNLRGSMNATRHVTRHDDARRSTQSACMHCPAKAAARAVANLIPSE